MAALGCRFSVCGHTALRRFVEDRCMQTAGSLTFTTLLSLVPLVTVTLSVLSLFPAFQELTGELRNLLMGQLMPTSGELVQRYLLQFSEKATRLTLFGSLWLLVTAVMTLATIDRALNGIWRSRRHRNTVMVFMVYWALLTLGPLLLGAAIAGSTYLYAVYKSHVYEGVAYYSDWLLLRMIPLLLETVAFFMLFVLVPRVRVRLRDALAGALLTAVLFEVAKRGFAMYVSQFKNYELVYGAFSAIPIFLIWLYLSWLIVLVGAEVTACLGGNCHRKSISDASARRSLWLASRLVARLGQAQRRGAAVPLAQLRAGEPAFSEGQVVGMLQRLAAARVVRQAVGGEWMLARDLRSLSLGELYRLGDFDLNPQGTRGHSSEIWDAWLEARLGEVQADVAGRLDVPLSNMLAASEDDDEEVDGNA
ncbi:MAG: YihY family inner membrane protein [Acidihalobacter sp.]